MSCSSLGLWCEMTIVCWGAPYICAICISIQFRFTDGIRLFMSSSFFYFILVLSLIVSRPFSYTIYVLTMQVQLHSGMNFITVHTVVCDAIYTCIFAWLHKPNPLLSAGRWQATNPLVQWFRRLFLHRKGVFENCVEDVMRGSCLLHKRA